MPYEIKWEERGVYSRFYGVVSGDELRTHAVAVSSDSRAADIDYAITDFTDLECHTISRTEVLYTAATDSLLQNVPLAVIYSKGLPADLALLELHRLSPLMSIRLMRIFVTEDDARKWIHDAAG